MATGPTKDVGQDALYCQVAAEFGEALDRLAHAYEANPEIRPDLVQEIHLALWRSFAVYDGKCSLRTWVYRVAHNTAASHVTRWLRLRRYGFVTIEELSEVPDGNVAPADVAADLARARERLHRLVHQLDPLDRQVMVSYLEDMDAATIAEITGLAPGAVAMKVHRIKKVLARRFHQGDSHDQ